jgi:two-component system sensor histidine kinase BaeS
MKTIQQVIRRSLVQISILILVLVILFTNIGFTWLFKSYVAQIRENETQLILSTVKDTFKDEALDADEKTLLRQTSNQSGTHVLVSDPLGNSLFDSAIGGNGNKRPLLSKEKKVLDLESLIYTPYEVKLENGTIVKVSIGQQAGWLLTREDIGFVFGVNLTFLAVLITALTLVWVLSKWLAHKISNPIVLMHQATEAIHQGQYHDIRLEKSETLELYDLAVALENLAFQLDHQEELRKRLTTDIAHELRSPLAVIKSQLEGISDGVLEPTVERLGRLDGEIMRLTKLIDDLGELTAVENELYKLNRKSLNASQLVTEIVEDFELLYEQNGLSLIKEIEQNLFLSLDEERFKQILVNLLSNAYKYTDSGSVAIRLYQDKQTIVMEVEDTGIGISQTDLPFIFERFYRVDPSRSRQTGGAGIGLAIVEQLVKSHGGKIVATSILGKGTKIQVILHKFFIS